MPRRSAPSVAQKNGIAAAKHSTRPAGVFGYMGSTAHSAKFDVVKKTAEAPAENAASRPAPARPESARPARTIAPKVP